ncbi:MAG: hypothetical protein COU46_00360, partial [Candidatus Niyogibacteria bacterium CG10_big_fil_rev_8_21_14_0_10_42_19]
NGSPSGFLPAGTTNTNISLNTDENATCKYSTSSGVSYSSMTETFSTTGGTTHSSNVSGLSDGNTYNYYVRCSDGSGNANIDDYIINFSVYQPGDYLVAHWKFDEESGSTAVDSSTFGHDATLYNGPARAAGQENGGLDFDGLNDYVQAPNSFILENIQEQNYTLSAWVKMDTTPPGMGSDYNQSYAIIMKEGLHEGLRFDNQNKFYMDHWFSGDVADSASSAAHTPGGWYHVTGVLDRTNGQTKIFVNGELKGFSLWAAGKSTKEYGTLPWRIGAAKSLTTDSWGWPADGKIDDVRVYNYALSDADVLDLYKTTDLTAPLRDNGSPSGFLPSGTTNTDIFLLTNENATCKYSTFSGISYASMTGTFSTTGGTSHSTNVSGLSDGNTYNYYVRCKDASIAGNTNTTDYLISFSIATSFGSSSRFTPVSGTLTTTGTAVNDGFSISDLARLDCGGGTCSSSNSWQVGFDNANPANTQINWEFDVSSLGIAGSQISQIDIEGSGCWHGGSSRSCDGLDHPEFAAGTAPQLQMQIYNWSTGTYSNFGEGYAISAMGAESLPGSNYQRYFKSKTSGFENGHISGTGRIRIRFNISGATIVGAEDVYGVYDLVLLSLWTGGLAPPPPGSFSTGGLWGSYERYFNNCLPSDCMGVFETARVETINFSDFDGHLQSVIGQPNYAKVRYRGAIFAQTAGTYNFRVNVYSTENTGFEIDRTRIWDWATGDKQQSIYLESGWHHIVLWVNVEGQTSSQLQFYWTPPGGSEAIVPGSVLSPPSWSKQILSIPDISKPKENMNYITAGVGAGDIEPIGPLTIQIPLPDVTILNSDSWIFWSYSNSDTITVNGINVLGIEATTPHGIKNGVMAARLPSSLVPQTGNQTLTLIFTNAFQPGLRANGVGVIVPYIDAAQPKGRVSLRVLGEHFYHEAGPVLVYPIEPGAQDSLSPVFIFGNGETAETWPTGRFRPNYIVWAAGDGIPPDEISVLDDNYTGPNGAKILVPMEFPWTSDNPATWYASYAREGYEFDIISPKYIDNQWSGSQENGPNTRGYIPPLTICAEGPPTCDILNTATWVAFQGISMNTDPDRFPGSDDGVDGSGESNNMIGGG